MTLEEVRAGIDAVDTQMKPLFLKRMECGKHVAEVKAQTGGDVFVLERELEIIEKRATDVDFVYTLPAGLFPCDIFNMLPLQKI